MKLTKIVFAFQILLVFLILTACGSDGSNNYKQVEETKSIEIARSFMQKIIDYNKENAKVDLTLMQSPEAVWDHLEEKGFTKKLSKNAFDATNMDKLFTDYSKIEAQFFENLIQVINYMQGYEIDDLIFSYNPLGKNSFVDVTIIPESLEKGIYLQDDSTEKFSIMINDVKGEGIKITRVVLLQTPFAVQNKYIWYNVAEYLPQLKDEIKKEKAEEQESNRLTLLRKTCEVENTYENEFMTFLYDGCTKITGELKTGSKLTLVREKQDYEEDYSFNIDFELFENTEEENLDGFDGSSYIGGEIELFDFKYTDKGTIYIGTIQEDKYKLKITTYRNVSSILEDIQFK